MQSDLIIGRSIQVLFFLVSPQRADGGKRLWCPGGKHHSRVQKLRLTQGIINQQLTLKFSLKYILLAHFTWHFYHYLYL